MTGWNEGRLHSAVLVTPPRERRRDRKLRRQSAKALRAEDREARRAAARAKAKELAVERKATVLLPPAGERGPAALRTPGRLRLPRHQNTSATLAGAYPFLAESGLGSDGVFVGQDLYSGSSFAYDPWELYARGPHHRAESGPRRDRRLGQVRAGQEPLQTVNPVRTTGPRARRPEG